MREKVIEIRMEREEMSWLEAFLQIDSMKHIP